MSDLYREDYAKMAHNCVKDADEFDVDDQNHWSLLHKARVYALLAACSDPERQARFATAAELNEKAIAEMESRKKGISDYDNAQRDSFDEKNPNSQEQNPQQIGFQF